MAERMEDKPRDVQDPPRKKRQYGRILLDAFAELILRVTTFCFGFLWWGMKWSLATVFFILVMAVAGFYVFNEAVANDAAIVAGKNYVTIPDIQSKHKSKAELELKQIGLRIDTSTDMPSDKVRPDFVIFQRPAPGTVVRAGRTVYATISRGNQFVQVPNLVNTKEIKARELIASAQLIVGQANARIPHSAEPDTVIGQYPPAGEKVETRSTVTLLVSDGMNRGPRVLVPDLKGLALEAARDQLAKLGLGMDIVKDPPVPGQPVDTVRMQVPAAGSEIQAHGKVAVNVIPKEDMPDAQRRASISYTVPQGFGARQVEIVIVGKDGSKTWAFPDASQMRGGQAAPKIEPGYSVKSDIRYTDELTVEIYVDGELVQRHYYEGENPPIVTNY